MADNNPIIDQYGDKIWHQNGLWHRTDGPAIELTNGDKYWYQNDETHRSGGPAVEYNDGNKRWYQNGLLHRTDGPAVEDVNGVKEWWIDGKKYSFKDWLQLCTLSHEEKCELVLTYD